MVQRREFFGIVLVTSLGVWLMLLLTLFLPTTGLLSRSPSDGLDQTLINVFLLSGAVASTACFITGLEKLEVGSKILGMRTATIPSLIDPPKQVQTGEIEGQTEEIDGEIEAQTKEIPEREWTWKHEQYRVKGKVRSVFRDVKSGRFSKDPVEPDGMRRLLGMATTIYPPGYTVQATGNPHSDCIMISYDPAQRQGPKEKAQKRRTRSRRGDTDEPEEA
jgi:hypothetical protein